MAEGQHQRPPFAQRERERLRLHLRRRRDEYRRRLFRRRHDVHRRQPLRAQGWVALLNILPSISRGGGPHEVRWRGFLEVERTPPPASLVPLPCKCRGG